MERRVAIRPVERTDAFRAISVAERSLSAERRQWIGLAIVALAAVAADQITKHVVASNIALDRAVKLFGPFSIHHVQNSGIAFGLFSSATVVVIVLTTVAVAWMLVFFARSGARHPALPVALGLLIGGSVSNLVDRVRLGYVTDFLDLRWWPAFNLADASIVVGVAVLLGSLLLVGRGQRPSLLIRVRVPAASAGLRLDRFLAGLDEVGSRAAAERLLAAGEVRVDGDRADEVLPARGGPAESSSSRRSRAARREPLDLRLAFEDEHLLVVDKPAGIVVHPGAGRSGGTLVHALLGRTAGGTRPSGPGSCTGSTGTRPDCSSWRGRRRRTAACARSFAATGWSASIWRSSAGDPGRGPGGSRRRSGATAPSRRASRWTRTRRATRSRISRSPSSCRSTRCSASASRPAARTRSGFTWRRSTCPSSATASTGCKDLGLERQFLHAARLAFPHPITGEPVETESPLPDDLSGRPGSTAARRDHARV